MAPGSEAGVNSGPRNGARQRRRSEVLAGLGESLCFSALPKLQPALEAAGLPCTSSSVTEGLMTATQSGATGLQLQFLPERWWEGDEMDRASAASTCCPCGGIGSRCSLGQPPVRTLRIVADAECQCVKCFWAG